MGVALLRGAALRAVRTSAVKLLEKEFSTHTREQRRLFVNCFLIGSYTSSSVVDNQGNAKNLEKNRQFNGADI